MYKITYTVKNKDGYLEDKTRSFDQMKVAITFMRALTGISNVVGKPILERI